MDIEKAFLQISMNVMLRDFYGWVIPRQFNMNLT